MLPHHPEVEFQIANLYEKMDEPANAMRHLRQLVALVQSDPGILAKLGALYADEDESLAFQYHLDVWIRHLSHHLTNCSCSLIDITR